MVFYTCAVCEVETGLDSLEELEVVRSLIAESGIPAMFKKLTHPLYDPATTSAQRGYAKAVVEELPGGLLKGARHVCRDCVRQLRGTGSDVDGETVEATARVPKRALVNGYFRGACPKELQNLEPIEVSLITLINVCVRVSMLTKGGHLGTQGTVFSILNDVVEIAEFLPSNPTPTQHAIIRQTSTVTPKDLRYNPHRVLQALKWLELNNHLYTGNTAIQVLINKGLLDEKWLDGGIDAEFEPEFISAEPEDFQGIEDKDRSAPAGYDGHAVNPGAPNSNMTDVLLMGDQTYASNVHQQRSIIDGVQLPVVTVRENGVFVKDYEVDYFMGKAFPVLYPYGQGCPSQTGVLFDHAYIAHLLHLGGDRSFQQCPSFIFYCYSWVMRRRTGSISYQATKHDNGIPEELSVEAVKEYLERLRSDPDAVGITTGEMRALRNKLKPYANQIPGTELYFEKERKNLIAMITSPVTTSVGKWTWFFTEAQSDKYIVEIFDNAITSARTTSKVDISASLEDRRRASDTLSEVTRMEILRDHPFLSARIHALQQDAFWKYVLNGEDKPLGEIIDFWLRAEFQMKGTPHWHSLISISNASLNGIDKKSIESDDPAVRQKVLDYVQAVSTNDLLKRDAGNNDQLYNIFTRPVDRVKETQFEFNIERPKYFCIDADHPGRHRFSAEGVDYAVDTTTGAIKDSTVRKVYRQLQLANQFHACRESCKKYCKPGGRDQCRYDFPRTPLPGNDIGPVIVKDTDKRNRSRVKVHPSRNNGNMNTCFRSPVCVLAMRGNHDIQYIQNVRGGAEYCSKYASKAEAAETSALQNAINRKLAQYVQNNSTLPHVRRKLGMVANAIVEAQQVGTVQACYMLGRQKLVISSRTFVHVNTLIRADITVHSVIVDDNELGHMDGNESALAQSPATQLGRRDAFHAFALYQHSTYGNVTETLTFYAFAVAFQLQPLTAKRKHKPLPSRVLIDKDGFIANANTCVLNEVRFCVIH